MLEAAMPTRPLGQSLTYTNLKVRLVFEMEWATPYYFKWLRPILAQNCHIGGAEFLYLRSLEYRSKKAIFGGEADLKF